MKLKLKDIKDADITTQLAEARKELRTHRFQYVVARSLENPMVIRNLRKKVARLLTVKREREIAAAKSAKK
ncbi:MAG: 50S ribosomal protein L29 [Leptospiraceae bacterium]|nr:50S ribosomal protein L29 [Leptospiraceae bacterium]